MLAPPQQKITEYFNVWSKLFLNQNKVQVELGTFNKVQVELE
jgi:hypothetical protein